MFGTSVGLFILGIVLIIAGLVLAGVEMVLPGFSIPGICSIICIIAGVALCSSSVGMALMVSGIVLGLLAVTFLVVVGLFQRGNLKSPIMLKAKTEGISADDLSGMLGKTGRVVTQLHPVGTAEFDGSDYEVMSEGRLIPAGATVTVIKVSRNKLTVRTAEAAEPANAE